MESEEERTADASLSGVWLILMQRELLSPTPAMQGHLLYLSRCVRSCIEAPPLNLLLRRQTRYPLRYKDSSRDTYKSHRNYAYDRTAERTDSMSQGQSAEEIRLRPEAMMRHGSGHRRNVYSPLSTRHCAHLLTLFQHPNICTLHSHCSSSPSHLLVAGEKQL